jgi:uncharacterized protein (TIGR03083 family)
MSATLVQVSGIPALGRSEAMRLAATEYQRFGDLLRQLDGTDWSQDTDCDRWTVKHIASHIVAMAHAMSSFREYFRQQKASKPLREKEGLSNFDAWTEYQALAFFDGDPSDLIRRYSDAVPQALKVRGRTSPARLIRMPDKTYGWMSIAGLRDDILTRDVWMHRVDISRATDRDLVLNAEHDGRFVANIVRDFAKRWKRPFTLFLEGPAGGTYVNGSGGEEYRLDAIEFCRILSGRSQGHGLPTDVVPF